MDRIYLDISQSYSVMFNNGEAEVIKYSNHLYHIVILKCSHDCGMFDNAKLKKYLFRTEMLSPRSGNSDIIFTHHYLSQANTAFWFNQVPSFPIS